MSQIDTTRTWIPGDSVDAAKMNEIIDQAFAEDAIITGQTSMGAAVDDADLVLIIDSSAVAPKLRQTTVASVRASGGVDTVDFAATPATVFNDTVTPPAHNGDVVISLSLANQTAGKVLAGPVSGSAAEPTFRVLTPADMPSATVIAIAALDIDWELGNVFMKTLPAGAGNTAFIFSHVADGQTIKVRLIQNATGNRTVSWPPAVVWRDSTTPVMTASNNARDIFTFTRIDTLTYGYADQNFTT